MCVCVLCKCVFISWSNTYSPLGIEISDRFGLVTIMKTVHLLCVGLQCHTKSGFHRDWGLLRGTESFALPEEHRGPEGLGWSVPPHCSPPKRQTCAHSARAAGEGKWLMAILKPSARTYYPRSSLYTCFTILSALFSFIIGLWLAISSNTSNSRADSLGTH